MQAPYIVTKRQKKYGTTNIYERPNYKGDYLYHRKQTQNLIKTFKSYEFAMEWLTTQGDKSKVYYTVCSELNMKWTFGFYKGIHCWHPSTPDYKINFGEYHKIKHTKPENKPINYSNIDYNIFF
jgi:hypothetical protein